MKKLGQKLWQIVEIICRFIITKVLHIQLSEEKWQAFFQFVKFGIVGVSNTLISYVLYTGGLLLLRTLGWAPNIDYIIAQAVAFVLSVLWSFYWNNKYVFSLEKNSSRSLFKTLLKTYVSYSFTGLFLNSVLLVLWVQVLHISKFVAPLINLLISVPLNFLINKFWAFKSEKNNEQDTSV